MTNDHITLPRYLTIIEMKYSTDRNVCRHGNATSLTTLMYSLPLDSSIYYNSGYNNIANSNKYYLVITNNIHYIFVLLFILIILNFLFFVGIAINYKIERHF